MSARYARHTRRAVPNRRQWVWSESFQQSLTIAPGAPQENNLMTTVDADLGLFVNKGYTVSRIIGAVRMTPLTILATGGAVLGIVMHDPTLPVPNPVTDHELRWLHKEAEFLAIPPGANGTTFLQTSQTHCFDTNVQARFPDLVKDLWAVMGCVGQSWTFQWWLKVGLKAP